jgi:hypothetical protein
MSSKTIKIKGKPVNNDYRPRLETVSSYFRVQGFNNVTIILRAKGLEVRTKDRRLFFFSFEELGAIFEIRESGVINMVQAWQYLQDECDMEEEKAVLLNFIYINNFNELRDFYNTRILIAKLSNPADVIFGMLQPDIQQETREKIKEIISNH